AQRFLRRLAAEPRRADSAFYLPGWYSDRHRRRCRRRRTACPHRMVVGMARSRQGKTNRAQARGVTAAAGRLAAFAAALAAGFAALGSAPAAGQTQPPSITRECAAPGTSTAPESPLHHVATAVQRRKRIKNQAL